MLRCTKSHRAKQQINQTMRVNPGLTINKNSTQRMITEKDTAQDSHGAISAGYHSHSLATKIKQLASIAKHSTYPYKLS